MSWRNALPNVLVGLPRSGNQDGCLMMAPSDGDLSSGRPANRRSRPIATTHGVLEGRA